MSSRTADIALNDVKVGDRIRHDLGDLRELADSMAKLGQLQPIKVTPDGVLVCGERRLEAARLLGWDEIEASQWSGAADEVTLLEAEEQENTCRKDLTPSERVAFTDRILSIERTRAKERQREAIKKRDDHGRATSSHENGSGPPRPQREAKNIAGRAAGWSGPSYQRAKYVFSAAEDTTAAPEVQEAARELAAQMDSGAMPIATAYTRVKAVMEPSRKMKEPSRKVVEPTRKVDKSRAAVADRRERLREMAEQGYTVGQIAHELGMAEESVRNVCKELEIRAADHVIGKRRRIDSNRVAQETVDAIGGLAVGVGLIDYTALDLEQVGGWATSLNKSMTVLRQFHKQLKEMTR